MNFNFSDVQRAWKSKAASLGRELPATAASADVIAAAFHAGLIDPNIDLLSAAVAVEALACESAGAALAFALHTSIVLSVAGDDRFTALARGGAATMPVCGQRSWRRLITHTSRSRKWPLRRSRASCAGTSRCARSRSRRSARRYQS